MISRSRLWGTLGFGHLGSTTGPLPDPFRTERSPARVWVRSERWHKAVALGNLCTFCFNKDRPPEQGPSDRHRKRLFLVFSVVAFHRELLEDGLFPGL